MGCRRVAGWLGVCVAWLAAVPAPAQPLVSSTAAGDGRPAEAGTAPSFPTASVPLEELPPAVRERVRRVMDQPTLCARGPAEAFHCRPTVYQWLLDHPDQAVRLWRFLGAECTDIDSEGDGRFRWQEPQAGEVHWETVLRGPRQRVWYAEGQIRPAPWMRASAVQAVVVLHYAEGKDREGKSAVRHQMDLWIHTDSRALALGARLFGASAPRLAEQYIGQMEMFFGALAWYLDQNPQKARAMFEQLRHPSG
jgi:hypothetical protein